MKPEKERKIIGQFLEQLIKMQLRQAKSKNKNQQFFDVESLLKSKKFMQILEDLANSNDSGWTNRLESIRPALKDDQRTLALMLYFGIPPKMITIMTRRTVNAIYTAKNRLKECLIASNSPQAKELMEVLGF